MTKVEVFDTGIRMYVKEARAHGVSERDILGVLEIHAMSIRLSVEKKEEDSRDISIESQMSLEEYEEGTE